MEQYTLPHQHGQSREQLLKHMPEAEYFQIIADIFKQLSDPTRLRIFWILCHCEAVSYTHLDVYKRQAFLFAVLLFSSIAPSDMCCSSDESIATVSCPCLLYTSRCV